MNWVDGIQLRSYAQNYMKNWNIKVRLAQLFANEDILLMENFFSKRNFHLRLWKYKRDK